MRIGLISDTHGTVLPFLHKALGGVDEIWHAGDIGGLSVLDELRALKPLRAVYGNIDDHRVRSECPESLVFCVEELKVAMMHIGGYPGRYTPLARKIIALERPALFISGHSHILKVMHDPRNGLLHMNPGAAGKLGIHRVMTLIRFTVENGKILNPEVVKYPR